MPHFRDIFKRFFLKLRRAGHRKKQQDVSPAVLSATGSKHLQREQFRNSILSTSSANHQQPSLWDKAYDALAEKMPDLVKYYDRLLAKEQMAKSAPNETLQPPALRGLHHHSDSSSRRVLLNTVIQNGLHKMEDNKQTYTIGGRTFVLADQIMQVTRFLQWGKDWIGIAVKNSPEASIVWSAVSLVVPLLTNPLTVAEANRDGFIYVTSRMDYYVALEPMLHRLGQNVSVDKALISATNAHIVDLYQAIIEFQLTSVLRFYQSRLKTYIHDIVPSTDWKQALHDIKTWEETVSNDFGLITDLAARHELERLNETSAATRTTMEDMLSVATQQLDVLKKQLALSEEAEQDRLLAKQRKCLQLFCLTQDGNGITYAWYKDRVELRVDGTCEWFFQHETFQKWLLQESGPLLVSADPGCGKSVLARYLIDDGLVQQSATICYFFFKDQDQNTIRQALCALLHQLFVQNNALILHAMELYNRFDASLVQFEASLWTILKNAVCDPQAGPVIFVIDALDECDELQLKSLITNLKNIYCDPKLANAKFKVLMTSRPYQHVSSEFHSLRAVFQHTHIHIPGEDEFEAIGREINSVIHHRVELLADRHQLSDEIKSSLAKKLLAIEHRTYLWVHLVFDYLEKGFKRTDDGIDAAIQTLPKSVNQAYDQMLSRPQEDKTVEAVKKALSIILAARRPLTLSEMNIAMSLDGQGRGRSIYDLGLEKDADFKNRLRSWCGLFVNVHHDKVYFLHQTAREFLLQSTAPTTVSSDLQWQSSITTRHAHYVLAEISMLYLDRLNSTPTERFRQDDHQCALLQYSVEYWDDHCREAKFEKGSAMIDLASRLCTPDLTNHSQWVSVISWGYMIRPESSMNVLVSSHLGLISVTELLLSRRADIEAKDILGKTALMLAAESGHEALTQLLVENGADIEVRDDDGRTASIYAARSGHEAILRQLLKNGANVEAMDDDGSTALMQAAASGHEAVLRLLLVIGADVEARDGDGRTALMLAADSDHNIVTRLLIEKGADVEAKDNDGRTALMLAADSDHETVTRLLLEKGADVEAKDKDGRTALMLAAESDHETVARLLISYDADVDATDNVGRTALMLAAESGHEAVIRLLLINGADIEASDNDDRTALIYAARSGLKAVLRLLLENGAMSRRRITKAG